ncbi:MAG: sigma-70 family RNA polymerase sigma factor [Tepidisphaerales bacterium]
MIAFSKPPRPPAVRPLVPPPASAAAPAALPREPASRSADELLADFRATGSQPAFEELVRRYAAMVFAECYAVTKRRHDAEDAAQATFLTLAVQARTGDEIRHLGAWLQRVARRVALDQEKARRRRNRREENHHRVNGSTGLATPHRESLDQLELRHQIHEELNRLPAKYRLPLVLHYYGGLTREQMAAELKCKPATLGVRLYRAREMLGKRLARRGITLSAAAIPVALASVIRESVEQHGVLAMAASASQIADAAARVAAGLPVSGYGVSTSVLAMAEAAVHELVLRKVRAVIAAAAIGASAIAAGGATVVHKLADAHLPQLLDFSQLLRTFTAPVVDLRVEAVRQHDAATPPPPDWPTALTLLRDEGMLQLLRVRAGGSEPMPAGLTPLAVVSGGPSGLDPVTLRLSATAGGSRAAGTPGAVATRQAASTPQPAATPQTPEPPPAAAAPVASAAAGAASREGDFTTMPPSAVLPLEDLPTPLSAVLYAGAGGGGGGVGGYTGTVSLAPVPPVHSTRGQAWRPAQGGLPLFATGAAEAVSAGQTADAQLSTTGDVLRGWGQPNLLGHLDNSGVVIADGYGRPRTLDLSRVASAYNSVPNPPAGINGWYARDGGALVLPPLRVAQGTSQVTWGDDPAADTLDLVNSLRLTVHDAQRAGWVTISLLAADRPEVPTAPAGYSPLTVWSLAGLQTLQLGGLDITARYGLPGGDLTASLAGLSLFFFDGRDWQVADAAIDPSRRLVHAAGLPPTPLLGLFTVADRLAALSGSVRPLAGDPLLDQLINPLAALSLSSLSMAGDVQEVVGWVSAETFMAPAQTGAAPSARLPSAVLTNTPLPGVGAVGGVGGWLPGVIPEPAALAPLTLAACLLGRRRR